MLVHMQSDDDSALEHDAPDSCVHVCVRQDQSLAACFCLCVDPLCWGGVCVGGGDRWGGGHTREFPIFPELLTTPFCKRHAEGKNRDDGNVPEEEQPDKLVEFLWVLGDVLEFAVRKQGQGNQERMSDMRACSLPHIQSSSCTVALRRPCEVRGSTGGLIGDVAVREESAA
jgi:hypothetical protein